MKLKYNKEKRLFVFYGTLNFLITHSILHFLLLILPIILATIIYHLTNLVLGYYFYGKYVFQNKNLTIITLKKYVLFSLLTWIINFSFIKLMYEIGINKNLSAVFTIPLLVLISYYFQKKYIFKKVFNYVDILLKNNQLLIIFQILQLEKFSMIFFGISHILNSIFLDTSK